MFFEAFHCNEWLVMLYRSKPYWSSYSPCDHCLVQCPRELPLISPEEMVTGRVSVFVGVRLVSLFALLDLLL